jgi:hypothetical protein
MSQTTCTKCKRSINEEEIIKTDEFREYGSEIKNYCPTCFLEEVKRGFGNYEIGNCEVCNSPLVLQYDDEETISLAREDFAVHFICPKVKAAIEKDDIAEIERLDEEEHGWLILYTIEPDPEEVEFGVE